MESKYQHTIEKVQREQMCPRGMSGEQRLNTTIDALDEMSDEGLMRQWQAIKRTWGETPKSSNHNMGIIIDYFLNYPLPRIAMANPELYDEYNGK